MFKKALPKTAAISEILAGKSRAGGSCPVCDCSKKAYVATARVPEKKKKTSWLENINQNTDFDFFSFGDVNQYGLKIPPGLGNMATRKATARKALASVRKNMPDMSGLSDAMKNVAYAQMLYGSRKKRRKTGPNKIPGPTLKQLKNLARRNKVNIYKMRKDRRGYTKTPLTKKALKARLSRARVSYKNIKAPRTRTRTRTDKRYVSSSSTRRPCPVGSYRDPYTGKCKGIPRREDLDELDSVNFEWNSDRTFGNKPLSMQSSRYGRSCFGSVPCDCGM